MTRFTQLFIGSLLIVGIGLLFVPTHAVKNSSSPTMAGNGNCQYANGLVRLCPQPKSFTTPAPVAHTLPMPTPTPEPEVSKPSVPSSASAQTDDQTAPVPTPDEAAPVTVEPASTEDWSEPGVHSSSITHLDRR